MLSIAPLRGNGQYYTSLGRDDYYLAGGEPPGVWIGAGAATLGLAGNIDPNTFHHLMAGFGPDGITPLVRNAGTQNRKPGWDLTFSVPKSVSELYAVLAGDDPEFDARYRAAIFRAVKDTLAHLEKVAGFGREGLGGAEHVPLRLIIAGFEHRSSRNYDPQVHWHCIVANAGVTTDGESRAIVSKYLFRYKMAAGALFRALLARELRNEFGLGLEAKGKWFEISGIPQSLLEAGSSRRKEILAELEKTGASGGVAAKIAALNTREAKIALGPETLFQRWKQVAMEHGFGREVAERLVNRSTRAEPIGSELVTGSINQILESQSFLSERDLVRAVAENVQAQGAALDDVVQKVRTELKKLVPLGEHQREVQFTTREMLDLEKTILARAFLGRLTSHHELEKGRVLKTASLHNLSREQVNALMHVTTRRGNLQLVQGLAGTGKSTLFKAARFAFQDAGFNVLGLCLSGKAAEGLEQSSGIKSFTIASALLQWKREISIVPRLNAKTILVVDEASMVGTRQLNEILEYANDAGAKVVLVGDRKQLPAIAAGAPFASLSEQIGVAGLTDIKRQVSEWGRRMVREFADGSVRAGLDALTDRGFVYVGEDREQAAHRLLMDWSQESILKDVLILAGTHEDVSWINGKAQKIRLEAGFLTGVPFQFGGKFFFVGERIVFGKNDRKIGVKNGTFGTIRGSKAGSIVVELDAGGKKVFVPPSYDQMKLGYAITSHKAQGTTVARSYILFSDALQSRELTYVQMSRAREFTKLFLTKEQAGDHDLSAAVRTMERSVAKRNATDIRTENDRFFVKQSSGMEPSITR